MQALGQKEICSLLIEGGGEIYASFLQQKLVDKVCWFVAPKIFGGKAAPGPIGGEGVQKVEDAVTLEKIHYQSFGDDLCIVGYPRYQA